MRTWKVVPAWLGGDPNHLIKYRNLWVRDRRETIKDLAQTNEIPPELLAGVAWIEVGGKPYSLKLLVLGIREFDHLGDPLLEKVTITKEPGKTSIGPLAMQLRRGAETLGLDYERLTSKQQSELLNCLQDPGKELIIVAKHLRTLKEIDFPRRIQLGPREARIIGTRYNRGPELSMEQILKNTSYGDFIVNRWEKFSKLLSE